MTDHSVVGEMAMLRQLLYAFRSLSDSNVFRWSEMLLDVVTDLHSGKRPSVREIAFRARHRGRRLTECRFQVTLESLIRFVQVGVGTAEKL